MSTNITYCNSTIWKHLGPYEAAIYERIRFLGAGKTWEQSAVEIAEQLHIPIRSFRDAANRLVDAGLVEKKRGKHTSFWSLRVYPFELENHFKNGSFCTSKSESRSADSALLNGGFCTSKANPTILYKEKDKRKKSIGADAPTSPNQEVDKTAASKTASTASKTTPSKTTSTSKTKKAKKDTTKTVKVEVRSIDVDSYQIPSWIDTKVWRDFVIKRGELVISLKKDPFTEASANRLVSQMERYKERFNAETVNAALDASVVNGNISIYPEQVAKIYDALFKLTKEEQKAKAFSDFHNSGKNPTKVINPDQNFPETSEATEEPMTNWERWLGPIS